MTLEAVGRLSPRLRKFRCSGIFSRDSRNRAAEMSDVTLTVAFGLADLAMTLVLVGRVTIEVARFFSYSAMAVYGAHALGVTISAPIAARPADTLYISASVWLIAGLLALCARGLHRLVVGKQKALNSR